MLDYNAQASLCRANLETLLAHLGFHVPTTLDYVYALSMSVSACTEFFDQLMTSIWLLTT